MRRALRWPAASLQVVACLVLTTVSAGVCVANTAGAFPPAVTNVLYASTGGTRDTLFTIDTATGAATFIGNTTIAGMPGLAVSPSGRLFVTSRTNPSGDPSNLVELDPATGFAVTIGSTGVSYLDAIAFDRSGTLWGLGDFGPEALYKIDISTAAETPIGPVGMDLSGMAFDPIDGRLYASAGGVGSDAIFTVDTSTAVATLIGSTGIGIVQDLAFDLHGTLYGVSAPMGGGGPSTLIRIDKATGAGTVIGATGAATSLSGMGSQAFLGQTTKNTLYGSTSSNTAAIGSLLTIKPLTGAGTTVGPTGLAGGHPGLAIDRDGNVFATGRSPGTAVDLYRVDAATGAAYRVGSTGFTYMDAIAFDRSNILWAAASDPQQLFQVDPATAAATLVGNTEQVLAGLAFDPSDNTLYGSAAGHGATPDGIYTVNTTTGLATLIGTTGVSSGATPDIAFDACGALYGVKGGGMGATTLIAIDKTTGAGAAVGPVGINNVAGLASRAFLHRFFRNFYSFTLDSVGEGFEIPNQEQHIRFLAPDFSTLRLQNQFSGDARVRCTGTTNYASITAFNPNQVTEQTPECLEVNISSQPTEVMIWKMPNGDLYKFQVLCFSIEETAPEAFHARGVFQADPIESNVLLAVGDLPGLQGLELTASVPNPFAHETRVDYALPAAGAVRLAVHDVQGRQVAVLVNGHQEPGRHSAVWDGRGSRGRAVRPGVYLMRLESAGQVRLMKVVKML